MLKHRSSKFYVLHACMDVRILTEDQLQEAMLCDSGNVAGQKDSKGEKQDAETSKLETWHVDTDARVEDLLNRRFVPMVVNDRGDLVAAVESNGGEVIKMDRQASLIVI